MDLLKQAADAFTVLKNVEYKIILSSGRNNPLEEIVINFCDTDFFHILGLQYLSDIDLPRNKKKLLSEINSGSLSDAYISQSEFYDNEKLGYSIRERIEMAAFIEQYMDSNLFTMAIYKYQHENRTKIVADYIITCRKILTDNEYYIFIRRRKGEDKYSIVTCFPRKSLTYWGGKRYLMLKEKTKDGDVKILFKHPKYSE